MSPRSRFAMVRNLLGLGLSADPYDGQARPIDDMWKLMSLVDAIGGPVSRQQAMAVPAVLQARRQVVSLATLPLAVYAAHTWAQQDNPLLRQIDPDVPNVVTMAQTLEDLLFDGISWWRKTARDFDNYPIAARHVDLKSVVVRPANGRAMPAPLPSGVDPREATGATVYVDGEYVPWADLIRFDSPMPPLLVTGARPIRRALALDAAAEMYANDPKPLDYFTAAEDVDEPDDARIEKALAEWRAWRRQRATGYVPRWLEYKEVDGPTPQELQIVELLRQTTVDISNAAGGDAEDFGVSTTSRTYANAVDRRQDKFNEVLSPYARAITDRLSMGDVTRRGYVVAFDLSEYLRANPVDQWTINQTAVDIGAAGPEEVRRWMRLGPRIPGDRKPEPAAPAAPAETDAGATTAAQASAALAALTFDGPLRTFELTSETVDFSVDRETRTIRGGIVPYGKLAEKYGLKFEFEPGSLELPKDVSRVKFLRGHDPNQALGYAMEIADRGRVWSGAFKIGRGPEGDRALERAEDKVEDGLSVGVEFDLQRDTVPHPRVKGALLVRRATVREVSQTPFPAFDDARVTRVAASRTEGISMECEHCHKVHAAGAPPCAAPTPAPATNPETPAAQFAGDPMAWFAAAMANWKGPAAPAAPASADAPAAPEGPAVVNPTRPHVFVGEPVPYRFTRNEQGAPIFVPNQQFDFSTDLAEMARENDTLGVKTDAGKRVMGLMRAAFDVDTADTNETVPTINRPDMYVDQREYRTPLWAFVNKGAPPNGVQPFGFPKFSSATGLVGDHTEGVEPTGGTLVTTGQTVTPSPLSGKAYLTREVWDMGGNPAVSTLVWNQMQRGYREGLETATAAFLNTLTAATDITLPAGAGDETLAAAWDAALVDLLFVRGYDFEAFAVEKELFKKFAAARDASERPLFPMINPMNANGTARTRFRTLDLSGVEAVPSWALPSTAGSPNNSWLFDVSTVWGWATAPTRLEFPGGSDDNTTYQPVAKVGIGIWGYKAFANTDIAGVRQVIYDTVP